MNSGGSAPVGEVLEVVETKVKELLTNVDYQKLPSGTDIRWRNTARGKGLTSSRIGCLSLSLEMGFRNSPTMVFGKSKQQQT